MSTPATSFLSDPSVFELTDRIAVFMYARFLKYLDSKTPSPGPIPPLDFNVHLVADIELMARRAAEAYENRLQLPWDADRYAEYLTKRPTGQNESEEDRLDKRFPPDPQLNGTLLVNPAVLVDIHDRILAWYLPHALSTTRQLSVWQCASHLEAVLQLGAGKDTGGWRSDPQFFKESGTCQPSPGCTNLSPAWFQQGRDRGEDKPEISAPLKPSSAELGTLTWLKDMAETFALLGAFLHIAHPQLYYAGRQVFRTFLDNPDLVQESTAVLEILKYWTSPFSGYSVVSNRMTPFHRDNYSRAQWYDLLATVGNYQGARLMLANVGVELQYDAGTVVALCGKLLRHGVPETAGDRVCIAQYMRDNVHAWTNVKAPDWMTWGGYPSATTSGWDPASIINSAY